MRTLSVFLPCLVSNQEVVAALLHDEMIQGIEERNNGLVVFIEELRSDAFLTQLLPTVQHLLDGATQSDWIEDQNWNEQWEKTITPIEVHPFWIRPTWHDASEGKIELIIDPKMSFGTGYHESTRLMLEALPEMVQKGDLVLDAGTGTGVLGFGALKLGAASVQAFDIDPICQENAEENASLNGLSEQFDVRTGDESVVSGQFDIVLANINREALRGMIPALHDMMNSDGRLGLAGLLTTDRELMVSTLQMEGLSVVRETEEGEWWSVWAKEDKK